jgi:glycosyltransferase involved in cell wall biosynthesis
MKGRRRILTLTSSFPRGPKDISGKFVKELSIELAKKGNDVVVLAPHLSGTKETENVDGVEVRRFHYMYPEGWEKLGGRAMLSQVRSDFSSRLLLPFFFLGELLSTLRLARRGDVDVIHSHWILPQGFVGALVSRITGKPHLLTTHSAGLFALEELPFTRGIADFIVKNSDGITCVSSYGERKLQAFISPQLKADVKNRTRIIPMGVGLDRFDGKSKDDLRQQRGLDVNIFLLLYVGRLDEVKGVEYLIRAMKILEDRKDVMLWVVGDGPLEDDLKRLSEKLGLDRTVVFLGRKTGDALDDIYAMADAVVVPSVVTPHGDTEGLPVVVMESQAAGKTVIATSVGGIPDAIENDKTGILVPERSPTKIAEAITRLQGDMEFRESLEASAKDNARNRYSWSTISEDFNSIIENMIQRRKA